MGAYTIPIHLEPGDVVVDTRTKDYGVLVRLICLSDLYLGSSFEFPSTNAWEMWWVDHGSTGSDGRSHTYTESGLINMIREGLLDLHKRN